MKSKHNSKKTTHVQSSNEEIYLKPKETKCYYMIHNNTNHKNNNNNNNNTNSNNTNNNKHNSSSKFIIKDNELAYIQNIINSNQHQIQTNIQFEYNNTNTNTYTNCNGIITLFYEILPKLKHCAITITTPSSSCINIEILHTLHNPPLFDIVLEINNNSDLISYYPKTMNIPVNEEHLYLLDELEIFKTDIDKLIELLSIYI